MFPNCPNFNFASVENQLEADGVCWAITADQDRAVKEAIGNIPEADWKEPRVALASNWPLEQKSTLQVLEWHNQRGRAENFLKERKGGFGLDRMSCGESFANAVFFRLGVIAYNRVPRLQAPVLSRMLVASHHRHLSLEADPGSRPDRPSCRAGDSQAGPGCGKAAPLSADPKAVS